MPRVKKEASVEPSSEQKKEQEVKKQKQEETTNMVIENATDWFNRLSGDDNLKHCAVTACKLIRDTVGIVYLDTMWPLIPMIYDAVFESLVEHLATKRALHKKYKIVVGHNFSLSYENIETGDAEQEGCFMPMMEHTGTTIRLQGKTSVSKKVTFTTIDNMYGENYATNSDIEHIKAMSMTKLQKMYSTDKDGKVVASDKAQIYMPPNLIMIIFSLYHDCILARLKMMKEAAPDDDIELDVLGLYRASLHDVDPSDSNFDGMYLQLEPSLYQKLAIKDNSREGSDK